MDGLVIRLFEKEDAKAASQVFYDSVHIGATKYYNVSERRAWAEKIPDTDRWQDRLISQKTFVAELNGKLVGFMTIAPDGYIDLAFVSPNLIGKGVAKALYDEIENEALNLGVSRLYSDASFLARLFFKRQGWIVLKEQIIEKGDVRITNFSMEKHLEI